MFEKFIMLSSSTVPRKTALQHYLFIPSSSKTSLGDFSAMPSLYFSHYSVAKWEIYIVSFKRVVQESGIKVYIMTAYCFVFQLNSDCKENHDPFFIDNLEKFVYNLKGSFIRNAKSKKTRNTRKKPWMWTVSRKKI